MKLAIEQNCLRVPFKKSRLWWETYFSSNFMPVSMSSSPWPCHCQIALEEKEPEIHGTLWTEVSQSFEQTPSLVNDYTLMSIHFTPAFSNSHKRDPYVQKNFCHLLVLPVIYEWDQRQDEGLNSARGVSLPYLRAETWPESCLILSVHESST